MKHSVGRKWSVSHKWRVLRRKSKDRSVRNSKRNIYDGGSSGEKTGREWDEWNCRCRNSKEHGLRANVHNYRGAPRLAGRGGGNAFEFRRKTSSDQIVLFWHAGLKNVSGCSKYRADKRTPGRRPSKKTARGNTRLVIISNLCLIIYEVRREHSEQIIRIEWVLI